MCLYSHFQDHPWPSFLYCIMNAWGALDEEVHGPGLDPLGLFVPILRYLGQCSHTAPSFLPSPPLFRQFRLGRFSGPSQCYLFCTNCSLFHGKPCIRKCPVLWPLDESAQLFVFEVFLLRRHRRQVSRAALKLPHPVGKYTYQSNAFSNKLGFSL